jgi:hypothetical protein
MSNAGPASSVSTDLVPVGGSGSAIGFYGATPITKRTTPNQAAVGQSLGTYSLFAINTVSVTPGSVAANTCAAQTLTFTGSPLIAGDICLVSKQTAQAGLGLVNSFVNGAGTVSTTYANLTVSPIVPAAESYLVVSLRTGLPGFPLTPTAVPANSTMEQQFAVPGLAAGGVVTVAKPTNQAGLGIAGFRIVADGVLGITYLNATAAAITPTAEAYTFFGGGGFDSATNSFLVGVNVGTLGAATAATTTELTVSNTVFGVNDAVIGISKPTFQAGLAVASARVSAASTLAITFVNPTAGGVTPTASEIYTVELWRPQGSPVAVLYSQALTPVAVAANTCAEQSFTVTGLIAGSFAFVNKPSFQSGLGIVNVRVSGINTLAITYANTTGAAITPTPETYSITNIVTMPAAGSYVAQSVTPGGLGQLALMNELRASMVALGLITGA